MQVFRLHRQHVEPLRDLDAHVHWVFFVCQHAFGACAVNIFQLRHRRNGDVRVVLGEPGQIRVAASVRHLLGQKTAFGRRNHDVRCMMAAQRGFFDQV